MFSQASVILSTGAGGGGGGLHPGRVCIKGRSAFRGICIKRGWAEHPLPLSDTTGYGQRTGGTHPTGMHSCIVSLSSSYKFYNRQVEAAPY